MSYRVHFLAFWGNWLFRFRDDPLRRTLSDLKGREVHFFPKSGNAGDGFITLSTFTLCEEYGIRVITHKESDDVRDALVFIGGGGNLVEGRYHEVRELIDRLCPLNEEVFLLPHTISGNRDVFTLTYSNLSIFCRDKVSFAHAMESGANPSSTFLSHDVTLFMGEDSLGNLFSPAPPPEGGRISILREDGESLSLKDVPPSNLDISLSWNGDIWQSKKFCDFVTKSLASYLEPFHEVVTDRLHVSILAAQLGKSVKLLPNAYFKNEAVFSHSLSKTFPNMTFGEGSEGREDRVPEILQENQLNDSMVIDEPNEMSLFKDWYPDEALIQLVVDEAARAGVASFDIFDTALTRTVDCPIDVFAGVEKKLIGTMGNGASGFGEARRRSEQTVRDRLFHELGAEEVTLDEIYEELKITFPHFDFLSREAKSLELELEFSSLVAVPDILLITQRLSALNIPFIFVSDMYLPEEFLAEVLHDKGYRAWADIFVSNATGATKATGRIWSVVKRKWPLSSLVHVGDNRHSDVVTPKALGINAIEFTRAVSESRTNRIPHPSVLPISISARHQEVASRRRPGSEEEPSELWARLGRSYGAVIAGSFLLWLRHRATVNDIDRLYFCSRDGYVLHRAWNALGLTESTGIEASYLQVSRKVLLFSSGFLDSDGTSVSRKLLSFLTSSFKRSLTVGQALDRAGLRASTRIESDAILTFGGLDHVIDSTVSSEKFETLLGRHAQEVKEAMKSTYESTVAYFRQEGLFGAGRHAIVDIGWHGTLQSSLSRILSPQSSDSFLGGFYFGLWPEASGNRFAAGPMESCFGSDFLPHSDQAGLVESVAALEELFSAPHGSVDGYQIDAKQNFEATYQERPDEANQYKRFIKPFHDGLIHELTAMFSGRSGAGTLPLDLTPQAGLRAIESLFLYPCQTELEALGQLRHSATFDHEHFSELIDQNVPQTADQVRVALNRSEWQVGQALVWLNKGKKDLSPSIESILTEFVNSRTRTSRP